jgi:PAS domain S-box-containing protein
MKILIVEDRIEDRILLRYYVEKHGHTAIEAGDGQEGLEKAATAHPDLIISDALMPKMDGFQFLRQVKQDTTLRAIPFIFYSAVYTGQKEEELARSLGATAFIIKPKEPEEFWEELNRIIESNEGGKTHPQAELLDEEEYLKKYSHIVATKLEEKVEELERAKEEIEKSEKKYRLIAENVRDVIWILSPNLKYIYVSPSVQRLRGFSVEEVMSQTLTDFLTPASLEETLKVFAEETEKEKFDHRDLERFRDLELEMLCKDGSTVWTEVRVSSIRDEKGQTVGILGVTRDISERKRAEEKLRQSFENLRKAMQGIIRAMASTVEARDPYTAGHQRRVADLARAIAQEMKLTEDQVDGLRMAGIVHDLGKIAVPAEILSKPIKLSDIEFRLIQVHPQAGYDILKDIDFPWPLARIVLQHHERMDGSGYPQGLKDKEILPESKILAVADVVEAMSSYRPYRPGWGIDKALEEISKQKGILYDSAVVDTCLKLFGEGRFQFDKGQEQRILMDE